jgi:hypothetical protein
MLAIVMLVAHTKSAWEIAAHRFVEFARNPWWD